MRPTAPSSTRRSSSPTGACSTVSCKAPWHSSRASPGRCERSTERRASSSEALEGGARVIISTIQKFGTDHLAEISGQSGRTFAVIIDEAHSSQSGKSAQAMSAALTREAENGSSADVEDAILAFQRARGPATEHLVLRLHRDAAQRDPGALRAPRC